MSETVRHKGTLTKLEKLPNETVENQCKRLINELNIDIDYIFPLYNSYKRVLMYDSDNKYFVYKNNVYLVENEEFDPDFDIFNATINNDGKIEYELMYYNGGCCFNEALEWAVKKINTL